MITKIEILADDKLYHVVIEGIDKCKNLATLCDQCSSKLQKGKLPKYCAASGYDLGKYSTLRFAFGELTMLEKVLLSPYRQFMPGIKLRPGMHL